MCTKVRKVFKNLTLSAKCTWRPAGKAQNLQRQSACKACAAGKYTVSQGFEVSSTCPAGKVCGSDYASVHYVSGAFAFVLLVVCVYWRRKADAYAERCAAAAAAAAAAVAAAHPVVKCRARDGDGGGTNTASSNETSTPHLATSSAPTFSIGSENP